MLLTITTTHQPASDLGYLLHKNPARAQSFSLTFGKAHVLYPEVTDQRCTAALILEIDPVGLVRGKAGQLEQYVNDRPYTASSFLSVAIAEVFTTALSGRSKDRPELAARAIPLKARIAVLPSRGGEALLRRLFEPLGYTVTAEPVALDPSFPDWGQSRYMSITLAATVRLADLLKHIYVLIPVLDDAKHYYVGDDEVEKLLRHGEGWLSEHPERNLITRRYLRHRSGLTRAALDRLIPEESAEAVDEEEPQPGVSLHTQRLNAVLEALKESGARRVLDLGCGQGRLLQLLSQEESFEEITGLDLSHRALEVAASRLRLDRLPAARRERIKLLHGSLTYRDQRLSGYDAAAVVEVIEHLEPHRLSTFERVLFEAARPATVVLTTPNREYNVLFEGLPEDRLRHGDHRFEWTRAEFTAWAERVAERHGYRVRLSPIGPEDPNHGAPSQMAVFTLKTEEQST